MNLFVVEDGIAKVHPETILVEPFKKIWERDTSKKKENAVKDMTFINFMASPFTSNIFKDILDMKKREEKIIESCFKGDYKPDEDVYSAIDWCTKQYLMDMSLSYRTLIAAKTSAENLNDFLINVDLNERNEKGYPMYKPAEITRATKDLAQQIDAIKKLEISVMEEYKESSRTRATSIINPLEK